MAQEQPGHRYVIITPVRDEAEYLQKTIDSLASQTVPPSKWIIVNDGSKDATAEIAQRAADQHPWIEVVHRADRGRRAVGPGVIEAFYDGYARLQGFDYDYICKIDGDISFGRTYFERLLSLFDGDSQLGSASGKCYCPWGGRLVEERIHDEMVLGGLKCYRRQCFDQIGGLVREVMWDGIDFHRARMCGWRTRSFRDFELRIIHYRQMGSSQRSIIHGRLRWGFGQYFMGTHPLFILASGFYRMRERPFVIGGLCIILGYVLAWWRRAPRYQDMEFRKELHRWQLRRLHLRH